jgi:ribonuclease HI
MKIKIMLDTACSNNQDAFKRKGAYACNIFVISESTTLKKFISKAEVGATDNQMQIKGLAAAISELKKTSYLKGVDTIDVYAPNKYLTSGLSWVNTSICKSSFPAKAANRDLWLELKTLSEDLFLNPQPTSLLNVVNNKWFSECAAKAKALSKS